MLNVHDLIDFYKRNLGPYNTVFKHMNRFWWVFIITVLTSIMLVEFLLIFRSFLLIIPLAVFVWIIISLNERAKQVLISRYGIASSGIIWGGDEWIVFKTNTLKAFLVKHDITEEEKIKSYITVLEKIAENRQTSKYLTLGLPSLLLGLIIPVWSNFNYWYYKNNIASTTEGLSYLIISIVIILLISVCLATVKKLVKELIDTDYKTIKNLILHMEEAKIGIEEDINHNEIDQSLLKKVKIDSNSDSKIFQFPGRKM